MNAGRPPEPGWTVVVDGTPLSAAPGETLAATLVAHGRLAQGVGKDGAPRGHFCGMGVCHDCLVTVDGRPGQRACLTKAADGMRVERPSSPLLSIQDAATGDLSPVPASAPLARAVDVLVVGAGPAGLCAARDAARAGAGVLVVDERPAPGGQYYKQGGSAAAPDPDAQMRSGAALIAEARAAGAALESETLAWGPREPPTAGWRSPPCGGGEAGLVTPRILVIATGAFERPAMVPGWTLPGVMTPGAAQTLWRSYGKVPGRRVLVAGNGPLGLQVARELRQAGCEVTLAEAAPAPWSRPGAGLRLAAADPVLAATGLSGLLALRRAGATILFGHRLVAVEGRDRAERAVLAGADGRTRALSCDSVLAADGFAPAADLPRLLGLDFTAGPAGDLRVARGDDGATAQPDVFVVGEAGGFGGAHVAAAQGALAGREAAGRIGNTPQGQDTAARRALARHRRFQQALWALFAPRSAGLPRTMPRWCAGARR